MSNELKVAFCLESSGETNLMASLLSRCTVPNEFDYFSSGLDLLKIFYQNKYDVILLDAYMEDLSGIEVARKIREIDVHVPIALIAMSDAVKIEELGLDNVLLLRKPVEQTVLCKLLKHVDELKQQEPCLTLMQNGSDLRLPFSQILCLEQQSRQVFIHLDHGEIEIVYDKISRLSKQFDTSNFIRPHSNYIVNLAYVTDLDMEQKQFTLANGKVVPIAQDRLNDSKHALAAYLFARTRSMFV